MDLRGQVGEGAGVERFDFWLDLNYLLGNMNRSDQVVN